MDFIQPDCSIIHFFWNFWVLGFLDFPPLRFSGFSDNKLLGLSFVCWIGGVGMVYFLQQFSADSVEVSQSNIPIMKCTFFHFPIITLSYIHVLNLFWFSIFTDNHIWRSKNTKSFWSGAFCNIWYFEHLSLTANNVILQTILNSPEDVWAGGQISGSNPVLGPTQQTSLQRKDQGKGLGWSIRIKDQNKGSR